MLSLLLSRAKEALRQVTVQNLVRELGHAREPEICITARELQSSTWSRKICFQIDSTSKTSMKVPTNNQML